MNLTRVLNVALPEIPARVVSEKPPRMAPNVVFKEHIDDGERVVRAVVPGVDAMFNIPAANWALAELFDGQRSYREIAELYSQQTAQQYGEAEVRDFADSMEEMGFWYKTPQEKNILLMQKSAEERRKLVQSRKSRFGDLSEIAFPAVNPDNFVTWLYEHSKFFYTRWFSAVTAVSFAIALGISIVHWDEISRDTVEFFNFSHKTANDVAVFYVLALITLCWHELGHAHACKHYGGRVPAMGFLLIYLTPAFYTDTTEGFVKGTRWQRFVIAMAGAWSELYIWAIATPIWWGTAPGTATHNAAYLLVLMTGIAGLFINWNPLMKLDGYYMLSEVLQITELKEDSTAYVSAWVKRHIWGLPVDVPYVPKNRRLGFAVYALLSGAYSYTILYVLARFAGNVFRNFNPEWSFIPELVVAGLIFRSRIKKLVQFMKFLYLDKKDRIRAWARTRIGRVVVGAVVLFCCVPLWRESVDGRFVLEPEVRAVVRNKVAGTIAQVFVGEGERVKAGEPLLELRNVQLQSTVGAKNAELALASIRAKDASVKYGDLGLALKEQSQFERQNAELQSQAQNLEVRSPIEGIVLTPKLREQLGEYVKEGAELVEVANLTEMRARVYVSDYEMHKVRLGANATVGIEAFAKLWPAQVSGITPVSTLRAAALSEKQAYEGLNAFNYYVVDLAITNGAEVLRPGMVGDARIYGERRSLLSHFGREVVRFFGRKIW